MTFAQRVYGLRERLKLTQEQLARRVGVSFATVNRWEAGTSQPQRARLRAFEALEQNAQAKVPSPTDVKDSSTSATLAQLLALPQLVAQLEARVAAMETELAKHRTDDELLTVPEFAALAKMTTGAVYGRIHRGSLKPLYIGRSPRLRRSGLEK